MGGWPSCPCATASCRRAAPSPWPSAAVARCWSGDGAAAAAAALAGIASDPVMRVGGTALRPGGVGRSLLGAVRRRADRRRPARVGRRARPRAPARPSSSAGRCWPAPSACTADGADLARSGGLVIETVVRRRPVRGDAAARRTRRRARRRRAAAVAARSPIARRPRRTRRDAEVVEVLPPDVATMDLAEAPPHRRRRRRARRRRSASTSSPRSATALGASMGATRVVTDRAGSATSARSARPASSSTRASTSRSASAARCSTPSGLGQPDHIVSVNTDPHCPMMQLADLAIVRRRQRRARRAGRARLGGRSRWPDVDVVVRRRRPGRRRPPRWCWRGPAARCCSSSAGPFPGAKNMYGGVVYGRDPRHAHPALVGGGADPALGHAPRDDGADRRRRRSPSTSAPTPGAGRPTTAPPPTGPTSTRGWPARPTTPAPSWCARRRPPGCSATAGRVVGVRTDRPDGDLTRRASSSPATASTRSSPRRPASTAAVDAEHYTVGVKETLALPKEVIDERFGVRGRDGVDIEILGVHAAASPGGGFVYTNLDTLAVGVVLKLPALAAQQRAGPRRSSPTLKAHPAIAPLVEGGEVKEYSAHVIPEAGFDMMPDAGRRRPARGRRRRGAVPRRRHLAGGRQLRHRLGPGRRRGGRRGAAHAATPRRRGLAGYRTRLETSVRARRPPQAAPASPDLVLSDRVQHQLPAAGLCNVVERHVPRRQPGARSRACAASLARGARRAPGVRAPRPGQGRVDGGAEAFG